MTTPVVTAHADRLRDRAGKMMKPGIGSYERFKKMFEQFSLEAGKSST